MKKYILNTVIVSGLMIAASSCDDNSWNNQLDGFEENKTIVDIQTLEYTLTDTDYANLAGNSTNKALANEDGVSKELTAVGTQHYFTDVITARKYVPAFLSDPDFTYFTLSDGSALKLTYNVATALPEEITAIGAAAQYTVSEEDYMQVWGSEEDYTLAFAPSKPADKNIPTVLKNAYPDAVNGDYIIVNYNNATTDPTFGATEEPTPSGATHKKVSKIESGMKYAIVAEGNAAVAIAVEKTYGYLNVVTSEVSGDNLTLTDETANFTFVSVDGGYNIIDANGRYVYQTGTYNSFNVSEDLPEEGAVWMVEFTSDGAAKIINTLVQKTIQYDTAYSSYGSYADERGIYPTLYIKNSVAEVPQKVVKVDSENMNAVYSFDGSSWSSPKNVIILNPADYTAMGQTYGNLSGTGPAQYLPLFLKQKFPYAQAEDAKFVVYKYYGGGATTYKCDEYVFNGSEWIINNGIIQETTQFVRRNGAWMYDPNVTINLPIGKNIEISSLYYQTCVDWVYENIDKPLGSTSIKSGKYYITSYGNNEYYAGTSAYQGNVDLRAAAARQQYPDAYANMSDEEVVATMKHRFCNEVMPGALSILHPDAAPVEGLDVIYTINFGVYTGSTTEYTIRFKVVGQGQFEYMDCTWDN